jgi:hypothetical protein
VSRLHQASDHGFPGWQWDDGPIFVGKDGRKWAVMWGKSCLDREELQNLSVLAVRYEQTKSHIGNLKALRAK